MKTGLGSEQLDRASAHLRETDERTLAEQSELTAIPAPPFQEEIRGRRMAELMAESGLEAIGTDGAGNVTSWYCEAPAPGDAAPIVLAAHLDTVFPEGTVVTVRRDGDQLRAPGIGDDGRGLAGILAVARALRAGDLRLRHPLMVIATVGEEGPGDLRGVRHLFGPDGAARGAAAFISLDGAGTRRIVSRAVGSRRLRVVVEGPGGHSWADFGLANPIHALTTAASRWVDLDRPGGTTLSVGRIGGGTSVNSIPEKAWLEVEIRSENEAALELLEPRVRSLLDGAVADENAPRAAGSPELTLVVTSLSNRPGGTTPPDDPLVQAAVEATAALGYEPLLVSSSTDANVPMSIGVPAITLGGGGEMGGAHTLDEWYRNTDGATGLARALLTVVKWDEACP
jgi:tripeptide aminopeptidase